MNSFELGLFATAVVCLAIVARRTLHNLKSALICTALISPVLFISIGSTTQFLTYDEPRFAAEAADIDNSSLFMWSHGASRTTDTLIGVPISILRSSILKSYTTNQMMLPAKLMHWALGFALVCLIYALLSRNFTKKQADPFFMVLFFYGTMGLPVNIFTLKIFNYDATSMLLGFCGVVYSFIYLKNRHASDGLLSLIFATLGAQEKPTASPLLILVMVIFTYTAFTSLKRRNALSFLMMTACAFGIPVVVSIVSWLSIGLIGRGGDLPSMDFSDIVNPITIFMMPISRFINGGGGWQKMSSAYFLLALTVLVVVIFAAGMLGFARYASDPVKHWRKNISERMGTLLGMSNAAGIMAVFLVALAGTYLVDGYWAPFFPIAEGNYIPPYSLSNVTWHMNAPTHFLHNIYYACFSYAIIFTAIPTIFIIMTVLLVYMAFRSPRRSDETWIGFELLLSLFLIYPFIYAYLQIPMAGRYFNIPIVFFTTAIILKFHNLMANAGKSYRYLATGLFMLAMIVEILPFRPIFASFRPIWSHSGEKFNQMPELGHIDTVWPGWGEEVMLCGKMILDKRRTLDPKQDENINLYIAYLGVWTTRPSTVKIFSITNRNTVLGTSEDDYYIINRSSAIREFVHFPYNATPYLKLENRGLVTAWVFRGCDINPNELLVK